MNRVATGATLPPAMIDDRDKPSALLVRRILRTSRTASLATLDAESGGAPYASLVQTACAPDGTPLMMMSDLARHSRNIAVDPRVSLLYAKSGPEAVGQTRVSVMGRAVRTDDPLLRERFMRRHFNARDYLAFADFHLYRMAIDTAHFIGGFGRIETLAESELVPVPAVPDELSAAEAEIVDHMNSDHTDTLQLYAHNLAGRPGFGWVMTGIDPEGLDLARHGTEARIDFPETVADADAARAALVQLAHKARGES